MLKRILLVLLCGFSVPVRAADDVLFDMGPVDVLIPFKETTATYLYDVMAGRGLVGTETALFRFKTVSATIGAITDLEGRGTPFLGLQTPLPGELFSGPIQFGIWAGRDFNQNLNRGGVKASVPIWK